MKKKYLLTVILFTLFFTKSNAQTVTASNTTPGAVATYTFTYVTAAAAGNGTTTTNIFLHEGRPSGFPNYAAINPLTSSNCTVSVNGVNVPVNATNFIFAASWTNGVQLRTTSIVVPAGATIVVVVSGIITNPNPFSGSYTFNWRTATDQGGAIQSYSNNLLSVNNSSIKDEVISVTPNPTGDFVQISGLKSTEKFYVFDILGKEIKSGVISDNEKINLQDVTSGVYFLKLENNKTIKIIRN